MHCPLKSLIIASLIGAMGARGIGSMASKIPAPKVVPRSPAGG